MELDIAKELHVPSEEVIVKTGYDKETLCLYDVLPQEDLFSYKLVISDPNRIAVSKFESLGIEVLVAEVSRIKGLWSNYQITPEEPVLGEDEEAVLRTYREYTAQFGKKRACEILFPV